MAGAETGAREGARRRCVRAFVAVAAVVVAADAVTKFVAVAQLSDRPPVRVLGGVLTLRLVRNSGAAFSVGDSFTLVFTVVSIVVAAVITGVAWRTSSMPWAVTLGLLLGGALGNLADRILRPPAPFREPFQGRVVDWIQLPHWPVFNLADTAIVCGGVVAVILAARGLHFDGTRTRES